MKKFNVKTCIYGHLHGTAIQEAIQGKIEEIELKLVNADALNFKVEQIK